MWSLYCDSVIVDVCIFNKEIEIRSINVQIVGPSKLNKQLAQTVFPVSGLLQSQFGTIWFGK